MRIYLDIRLTTPPAALGAAALSCGRSGSSTRMPVIGFLGGPNHPYALARRPMR